MSLERRGGTQGLHVVWDAGTAGCDGWLGRYILLLAVAVPHACSSCLFWSSKCARAAHTI